MTPTYNKEYRSDFTKQLKTISIAEPWETSSIPYANFILEELRGRDRGEGEEEEEEELGPNSACSCGSCLHVNFSWIGVLCRTLWSKTAKNRNFDQIFTFKWSLCPTPCTDPGQIWQNTVN